MYFIKIPCMNKAVEEEFLKMLTSHKLIIYKITNIYCDTSDEKHDLMQEIVISCWKAYPHYRNESKISTWIYKIALNTAITNYRKSRRRIRISPLNDQTFNQMTEHLTVDPEEEIKMLYLAISKLLPVDKAIILLYLEERTYQEIAEITGITVGNAGMRIKRAKEKLINIITKLNK